MTLFIRKEYQKLISKRAFDKVGYLLCLIYFPYFVRLDYWVT